MNLFYNSCSVSSEMTDMMYGDEEISFFPPLKHTPICNGSLCGSVYVITPHGDILIQDFWVDSNQKFIFKRVNNYSIEIIPEKCSINLFTGKIVLEWDGEPGGHYCICDYECFENPL